MHISYSFSPAREKQQKRDLNQHPSNIIVLGKPPWCKFQDFPHFFVTNTATPTAKWEAAKQRASEPPLFRLSQPGKAQQRDVALSSPEHCHQWRELLFVEQPFTWPVETHFHFQTAHNLMDHLNPQPPKIIFWGNSRAIFP